MERIQANKPCEVYQQKAQHLFKERPGLALATPVQALLSDSKSHNTVHETFSISNSDCEKMGASPNMMVNE